MKCDGESRFRINKPKVIHEDFGGEVVIIHFDTGRYYSLNKTASFIWQLIDGGGCRPGDNGCANPQLGM